MADSRAQFPTVDPALAAAAKLPPMTGLDLLVQAGRVGLARHAVKLYAYQDDVWSGDDERAVHQMRVATRRMRAVLEVIGDSFKPKAVAPVEKSLRRLARLLGQVRDGDVFLAHLRTYRHGLDMQATADFDGFIAAVKGERAVANAELRHELTTKRYRHLLSALTLLSTSALKDVAAYDHELPLLVRHRAGSVCWSRYEAVRRFETILPAATADQLHALRIACKHLRYSLELFEPLLQGDADALLDPVRELQEQLGDIHDADVAVARAQAYLYKEGTVPVILRYIAARETARVTAVLALPALWERLTGDGYRQTTAAALARL